MTDNDHRSFDRHAHNTSGGPHDECITPADFIEASTAVPITVWRLDDRDGDPTTGPGARFESRLARRLILTYTCPGETVVDLDSDQHLREAAVASSRLYLAITHHRELAIVTGAVSLVVLHWPQPGPARTLTSSADLLAACRPIMSIDTCVIAAVRSAEPGQPGATYAQHLTALLPTAQTAGLTHVLQIVAVTGPSNGDQFLYYATRAEADTARNTSPTHHIDLLVFTPSRRGRG